jgi:glycosyltransferase involved in cell wall biosynthesis
VRILFNEFCGHAFQIALSKELADRGHQVLHLYFADNLSTPKGDTKTVHNSLTIESLHIPMKFSKHSIWTRRRADIAYGRAVAAKMASFKPDVVLSANMPLDAQRIVQNAARRHKVKFVFSLQDVYSSAMRFVMRKKLGSALSAIIGAYYEGLEKKLLRRSDAVICIAPGFQEIATDWGVAPSQAVVIENWGPLGEIRPTDKNNAWARENGIEKDFCFIYSGTLGMKHRPALLLELARSLEPGGGAKVVVVAEGAGADWLRENAQDVGKDRLLLLPFQPNSRVPEVMGSSDVLIALLDSNAGAFSVPSKVLGYLCAGRPLLLAAPHENHAAAVVRLADAGLVISPDSASEFVEAASSLMKNAGLRARYAANARRYAEKSFDIATITDRFLEVLPPKSLTLS